MSMRIKPKVPLTFLCSGGKNKGFKMLEKMGWEGGGLGRSKDGIQEPIQVQQRANKSGLGTDIPVEASNKYIHKIH